MDHVFLSHSSQDKAFVRRLQADLNRAGIETWLDEAELRAGDDLALVDAAVRRSAGLVVVISRASAGSPWVDREIRLARSVRIPLLPALVEDVPWDWHVEGMETAHADFRREQGYRRALHGLVLDIKGEDRRAAYLTAKEAVQLVRRRRDPAGELFGVSQQGVATLYSLVNLRDWEVADAADGASRFWVVEFFSDRDDRISPYAVIDGRIHDLPVMHLLHSVKAPAQGQVATVFSCGLNHLEGMGKEAAGRLIAEHADEFTVVDRRSRFRPLVICRRFVDSTEAVTVARGTERARKMLTPAPDLLTLTRLEHDKRNAGHLTWTVAFFDPALKESVLTVGIDGESGAVLHPEMRSELLNADFMSMTVNDEGGITVSIKNQMDAQDFRPSDIPADPSGLAGRLDAAEALRLVQQAMDVRTDGPWQLGILSNTGRTPLFSPRLTSAEEALMERDGLAGQWVVEVFTVESKTVYDGGRRGHLYGFRQLVCTQRDGAVDRTEDDIKILTAPLSDSPLPADIISSYERARKLAIRSGPPRFTRMSVGLARSAPACWVFRFYDPSDLIGRRHVSVDGRRIVPHG